jgi:hypothetical protein
MGIAIDGVAVGKSADFAKTTNSVSTGPLTTSQNGIVCVAVVNRGFFQQSNSLSAIQDSSGENLVWRYIASVLDPGGHGLVEFWYTVTAQPFTNVSVTAYFPNPTETALIIAWGMDGLNLSNGVTVFPPNEGTFLVNANSGPVPGGGSFFTQSNPPPVGQSPPLDPSTSLPVETSSVSNPVSITITTKDAPDIGIVIWSGSDASVADMGPGWGLLSSISQNKTFEIDATLEVYYQIFNAPENTLPVSISLNTGGAETSMVLAHAFMASGAVAATTSKVSGVGF